MNTTLIVVGGILLSIIVTLVFGRLMFMYFFGSTKDLERAERAERAEKDSKELEKQ